jgi:hypothetical protein
LLNAAKGLSLRESIGKLGGGVKSNTLRPALASSLWLLRVKRAKLLTAAKPRQVKVHLS